MNPRSPALMLIVGALTFFVSASAEARGWGNWFRSCAASLGPAKTTVPELRPEYGWASETVRRKLGYVPEVKIVPGECGACFEARAYNQYGIVVGVFPILLRSPIDMSVGYVEINGDYQHKGLSELLMAVLLTRYPDVKMIRSSLGDDNKRWTLIHHAGGLPCDQAIMQSPAGKMRVRFGFHLISKPSCPDDGKATDLYFVVAR